MHIGRHSPIGPFYPIHMLMALDGISALLPCYSAPSPLEPHLQFPYMGLGVQFLARSYHILCVDM